MNAKCGKGRLENKRKQKVDLLITHKAAKGHAAPAHASHQAASKRLSAIAINAVAILVVDGDGLGAGAHKGVLARAAKGGAGGHGVESVGAVGRVEVVKVALAVRVGGVVIEVEVEVEVEVRGGQTQVFGVGRRREKAAVAKRTVDVDGFRLG